MSDQDAAVQEVLDSMNQIVARDGGDIKLIDFDAAAGVLNVEYRMGVDPDCATCSIPPEMLQSFLVEGLRAHGVTTNEVIVAGVE
ncbi:NifU family protein [Georgenia daeguensis]|uniref:NIF system FeS cluster assembly NifU C-terminal domain-containing protein n=1 Tax=Georgenia daeguensis TaxID=908355 RepID=A0ABP8EV69_9MICO